MLKSPELTPVNSTKYASLIGEKHGRLTVVGIAGRGVKNRALYMQCVCDCGSHTPANYSLMKSGDIVSCGCRHLETVYTIHGGKGTPVYRLWTRMKNRCYNTNNQDYKYYGGRGILVCDEWLEKKGIGFIHFRDWAMEHGYKPGLEIDRENNDGNYTTVNCRFVTRLVNIRNTRWNRNVEAFGETKCVSAWAEDPRCVVTYKQLDHRVYVGWDMEKALTTPARKGNWSHK